MNTFSPSAELNELASESVINGGITVKRIIKKYKTNRSTLILAIANVILGAVFLAAFFSFIYIMDDMIEALGGIGTIFLLPAWTVIGFLSIAVLFIGILFAVSGIVCFVLVYPYLGRLRDIRRARRKNGGKLPKEMLAEMLSSGELDENEYQRELEKYAPAEEERSECPKGNMLLMLFGGLIIGAVMLGIPALMVYILGKLH